jgi:hypothetical protein
MGCECENGFALPALPEAMNNCEAFQSISELKVNFDPIGEVLTRFSGNPPNILK